jgi:capsular polysaccharide biosynthesis protein
MSDSTQQDTSPASSDGAPAETTPPEPSVSAREEQEVSIIDLLLVLARRRKMIVRVLLATTLLCTVYAFVTPEQFTSYTTVVRESPNETPSFSGGFSALQGLGVNIGGGSSGLSPKAYPQILMSREVRLRAARDTFYFPDVDERMSYVEYANRPPGPLDHLYNYTIRLPWTLKNDLISLIAHLRGLDGSQKAADAEEADDDADESPYPTREEEIALRKIGGLVSYSISDETGLLTIEVTTQDPELSAKMNDRFVHHLSKRVRELRTEKAAETLTFVEERFAEAEEELEQAEQRLANFLTRNQQISTPQLQFREDQLRRQVTFKQNLYSELQKRLTQSRIEYQRRQPVVTVLEEATPPLNRSGLKRSFIILVGVFVGLFGGIIVAFVQAMISARAEEDDSGDVEELRRELFSVKAWTKAVREQIPFRNGKQDATDPSSTS